MPTKQRAKKPAQTKRGARKVSTRREETGTRASAGAKVAGMSSAAVEAATGKGWEAWCAILDAAGAKSMSHKDIAIYLHDRHGVSDWWSQMVTVGYEQARGRREKQQKPDGFSVSASKTVSVPVDRLFEAWRDAKVRARWLPDAGFTLRKATPSKSMRITWVDGHTNVEANFYAKSGDRSQVAVQHGKLPDAAAGARMKAYWAAALEKLKSLLT